ncbi:aspartate aminotransferase family protein [Candidatus Roizmanbacteria bacterium]|nr:aspartate aminotransferase family protein [Candidatus Roizmanbacteria bacterium]
MIKNHIVYNPAVDWRFDFAKAEDSYVWDDKGKRYIDFSSGWNTTNLGWNHPEVRDAIIEQVKKNVYAPMWTMDPIQAEYAKALIDVFPQELDVVGRATGGTEANEMALKISRAVTGRKQIISFAHTYHGQSFGTLALGFIPDYVKAIAPLVPEFIQMEYPVTTLSHFLEKLEMHLKTEQVAAVFTEPGIITGWGSMLIAPKGYLSAVRALTQKYGTLLVVDEIGTGFSRTGKLFAIEHDQVVPDIVTLAKGISNGAGAMGAVVTKKKMVENYIGLFKPTSSAGWNPLVCGAALKTLEVHQRDKVWLEAARKGVIVKQLLQKELSGNPNMKNLRGWGLEIAFNISEDNRNGEDNSDLSTKIVEKCFSKGLHLADAGDAIVLMPPLTTPDTVLEEGVSILVDVIKKI